MLRVPRKQVFRYPHFSDLHWQEKRLRQSIEKFGAKSRSFVLRGLIYAKQKHSGQYRTGSGRKYPYIVHPIRVCRTLIEELHITDPDLLVAALLHDVIEDCGVTAEELTREFSRGSSKLVRQVSENSFGSREEYLKHIPHASNGARLIKVVDRLDNLQALEGVRFWSRQELEEYLQETERYILPIAKVTSDFVYDQLTVVVSYLRKVKQPIRS